MNNSPAESRAWRQLKPAAWFQRGSGGPELNRGDLWEAQGTSRRVTATAKLKCAVVDFFDSDCLASQAGAQIDFFL